MAEPVSLFCRPLHSVDHVQVPEDPFHESNQDRPDAIFLLDQVC